MARKDKRPHDDADCEGSTKASKVSDKRAREAEAEEGFAAGPGEFSVTMLSGQSADSAPSVLVSTKNERSKCAQNVLCMQANNTN